MLAHEKKPSIESVVQHLSAKFSCLEESMSLQSQKVSASMSALEIRISQFGAENVLQDRSIRELYGVLERKAA